jgi:hypothetical protein
MNFILPYLLLILQYEETGNNLYRILVIVSLFSNHCSANPPQTSNPPQTPIRKTLIDMKDEKNADFNKIYW